MNIKYRIIEVQQDNRVMIVRYFTDIITENDLDVLPKDVRDSNTSPARCKSDVSLNIPLPEPSEEELHKIILRYAPLEALKTLEEIKKEPNSSILKTIHTIKNKTFIKTEQQIKDMFAPPKTVISDQKIKEIMDNIKI